MGHNMKRINRSIAIDPDVYERIKRAAEASRRHVGAMIEVMAVEYEKSQAREAQGEGASK